MTKRLKLLLTALKNLAPPAGLAPATLPIPSGCFNSSIIKKKAIEIASYRFKKSRSSRAGLAPATLPIASGCSKYSGIKIKKAIEIASNHFKKSRSSSWTGTSDTPDYIGML